VTRNTLIGVNQSSSPVLIDTLREGYVSKGSEVAFLSTGADASVIVDGTLYKLPEGSVVKVRAGSDAEGRITIRNSRLVSFAFPDVALFINGTQVASGLSGEFNLPSHTYFQANLTYAIRPTGGEIRQIMVNGRKIRAGAENSRILVNYRSGAIGEDLTLVSYPAFFEGAATSFAISEAVIASFEPGPGFAGQAPLTIAFRDNSAGSPDRWQWDFGDGTRSDEQHPMHAYTVPGAYTVTFTVSRSDQVDTLIRKQAIIVHPPRVVANFSARPLKGPAPLTVRFNDASINAPSSWIWTFGPNSTPLTSLEQNPLVTYSSPGPYTVSLTAGNVYGSSDITFPQYIMVTESFRNPDKSIIVRTGKQGYIEKDSVVEFVVQDRPASISIDGLPRELTQGSVIRLEALSDQEGEIYIDQNEILKFSFPDIAVYVNGEILAEGEINNIFVPSYSIFRTALSYYLEPNSAYTYTAINGIDLLGDLDNAWIRISNIGPNSGGSLRLISSSNSTYIDGAMNMTVHDWILVE
jgi:PKD repeat protein